VPNQPLAETLTGPSSGTFGSLVTSPSSAYPRCASSVGLRPRASMAFGLKSSRPVARSRTNRLTSVSAWICMAPHFLTRELWTAMDLGGVNRGSSPQFDHGRLAALTSRVHTNRRMLSPACTLPRGEELGSDRHGKGGVPHR